MRGGSQSYLVQGIDKRFYVAKFTGNPQGNRTLINEWITAGLLRKLGITTPNLVALGYDGSSLGGTPFFKVGSHEIPVDHGLHLGSLCPVNPDEQAIFDFLPQKLLKNTVNLEEFAAVLVMDTFLGQSDRRQCIFVRTRGAQALSFRAYFVDHGMAFGGSAWMLESPKADYFYFDRLVYSTIELARLCEHSIEQIEAINERDLLETVTGIPMPWFAPGDHDALTRLYGSLNRRKLCLRSLVATQLQLLEPACGVSGSYSCVY